MVMVLGAGAWVGARALMAKAELEAAVPLAASLKDAVAQNDMALVSRTSSELHRHSSSAAALTSDPVWRAAEILPVVGPNLTAVRQLAQVTVDISTNAIGPLTRLATSIELSDFKPVDGAVDLRPLVSAQPVIAEASTALRGANKRLEAIDTSRTLDAIAQAKTKLSNQLSVVSPGIEVLNNAASLLPLMLGNESPRKYLVLFQNPAELRATGGISGAMALINTDKGKINLAQQASSSDFPHYSQPVADLPIDTRGLFGDIVGEYIQDVNLTPNFPLSASLAKKMWSDRFGTEVDGVISLDPVALGYLLDATGPVKLATGDELTSSNAVSLLLNEVYKRYPIPAQQDLFFASAAKAVFDKVAGGDLDPSKLVAALTKSGAEGRILVWNSRSDEQAQLAGTSLGGVPLPSRGSPNSLGLYLNDGTGAKMGYYLDVTTAAGAVTCRDDGRPYFGVQVKLTNSAPADAARLPAYITGAGEYGVAAGTVRTIVSAYGTAGMSNLGVARDGSVEASHSAQDSGMPVTQFSVDLAPGQSTILLFGFLGAAGESAQPSTELLQTTPFINMNETSELSLTCESALW
jgi:hypothetical protein